jgi:hypothetical protein
MNAEIVDGTELRRRALAEMTDERKRIRIAELCGWTKHKVDMHKGEAVFETFWLRPGVNLDALSADDIAWREGTSPPDYPKDLNAMHKAVMWLKAKRPSNYERYLFQLRKRSHPAAPEDAEALLRADAFLAAMFGGIPGWDNSDSNEG